MEGSRVGLPASRRKSACLMDASLVIPKYLPRFLSRHSGRPFFVWLHFMDPHDPYAPPPEYRAGIVRDTGPWPVFAPHDPTVGTPTDTPIRAGNVYLDAAAREYISDLYDAEIAYADEVFGEAQRLVDVMPTLFAS